MKNSNTLSAEKFQKCPYQSLVYGVDKCDLIYRTSYKGDWGHWDEMPDTVETTLNHKAPVPMKTQQAKQSTHKI